LEMRSNPTFPNRLQSADITIQDENPKIPSDDTLEQVCCQWRKVFTYVQNKVA
jgi:hypothetical protein